MEQIAQITGYVVIFGLVLAALLYSVGKVVNAHYKLYYYGLKREIMNTLIGIEKHYKGDDYLDKKMVQRILYDLHRRHHVDIGRLRCEEAVHWRKVLGDSDE